MIPIAAELDNLTKPAALREDEYLGEDSLVYCSKCRTGLECSDTFITSTKTK